MLERVRRSYRHCPKESRLLPFILVAKGARVRFWNFDGPHQVTPAGLPTHTSYWFSSRRSFRSCRVRLSLTRLHTALWSFSIDSPLRVCAYLLRSFVYTTGVLAPDKPALCVCVARAHAHARTFARKRAEGERARKERREREKTRERWCVPTHTVGLSSLLSSPRRLAPPLSSRGRRFGAGQKHREHRSSGSRLDHWNRVLRELRSGVALADANLLVDLVAQISQIPVDAMTRDSRVKFMRN